MAKKQITEAQLTKIVEDATREVLGTILNEGLKKQTKGRSLNCGQGKNCNSKTTKH